MQTKIKQQQQKEVEKNMKQNLLILVFFIHFILAVIYATTENSSMKWQPMVMSVHK